MTEIEIADRKKFSIALHEKFRGYDLAIYAHDHPEDAGTFIDNDVEQIYEGWQLANEVAGRNKIPER